MRGWLCGVSMRRSWFWGEALLAPDEVSNKSGNYVFT